MRWATWPKLWFVSWTVELPGIAKTVNTVKSWWRCKLVPTFSTYFDLVQAVSWEFLGIVARLGLFQHVLWLATKRPGAALVSGFQEQNRMLLWMMPQEEKDEARNWVNVVSLQAGESWSMTQVWLCRQASAWFPCDLKLLTFGDYVSSLWFGMLQGAVCWKKHQSSLWLLAVDSALEIAPICFSLSFEALLQDIINT